ncbi:MAG: hypothetical protein MUE74_07815, partial [Bacteroidales bacterium]|nr:hypothetical protein [Bacteroidales bacterium]
PDFGAYEQIGSGVFADEALEALLNNRASAKSRLAWTKRMFPVSVRQAEDGSLPVNLREPVEQGISVTISWSDSRLKAKPAVIQLNKSQDRRTFKFILPANSKIPEGVRIHILLEEDGHREEWDIPVTART